MRKILSINFRNGFQGKLNHEYLPYRQSLLRSRCHSTLKLNSVFPLCYVIMGYIIFSENKKIFVKETYIFFFKLLGMQI